MASGEKWDLLNIPAQFKCYRRALQSGKAMARRRGIPIMIRHHGARHLEDDTRVNQYVLPDGRVDIRRDASGARIDAC